MGRWRSRSGSSTNRLSGASERSRPSSNGTRRYPSFPSSRRSSKEWSASVAESLRDIQARLKRQITGQNGNGPGLAIYRHAYRSRLIEALEADFPAVRGVLGAEEFASLISSYVMACPSREFNIGAVGRFLPDWLKSRETPEIPYLAELATL